MSRILIAGPDLQYKPVADRDLKSITGEGIAELTGVGSPNEIIVFQQLKDGSLETLRLNEKATIEDDFELRFIVFRGAATYFFEIDGRRFEWGASEIRGDVLKKLIGVDPAHYGVWQQSNTGDDRLIDNDKFADLQGRGLEIFFTARKESTEGTQS